jgi:hypothetical protein
MKVIAWYRDGGFWEVEYGESMTVHEAIEKAKQEVPEANMVEKWEVEEDFL